MGQSAGKSKLAEDSPCSKCVVSNRFLVMALAVFIAVMSFVVLILLWALPLDQTLQIVVTVMSGVAAILALAIAGIPKKCNPCLCTV